MSFKVKKIILSFVLLLFYQCVDNDSISNGTNHNPPKATEVFASGPPVVGHLIEGSYTFNPNGGGNEGNSIYKWYRADDKSGANRFEIPDQNKQTYQLTDADLSKYISFQVTPANLMNVKGSAVSSNYLGKIKSKAAISASKITEYKIKNGEIVISKDYTVVGKLYKVQQDRDKQKKIWDLVKKIIPLQYLNRMDKLIIFWGDTDSQNAVGYVSSKGDLKRWNLGIAIDFAYPQGVFNGDGELEKTILHEFAHILTLNNLQLDSSISTDKCPTFFPDYPKEGFAWRGCAFGNSYMNRFFQSFWTGLWSNNPKAVKKNFSNVYPDQFVSNYAGVSPSEDLAETYWNYVLNIPQKPGTIAEQKVNSFKKIPEFEQIKAFELANLGLNGNNRSSRKSPFSINRKARKHKMKSGHYRGCVRLD